jgi:chromosome segregation ATPase
MGDDWNRSLRLKRFEVAKTAQKVASLETIIRDLDGMTASLSQQIAAEEERTKVRDARLAHYSMAALSAATRRKKLMVSLADLRAALEAAKRDHAAAADDARDLESALGVPVEVQHGTKQRPTS